MKKINLKPTILALATLMAMPISTFADDFTGFNLVDAIDNVNNLSEEGKRYKRGEVTRDIVTIDLSQLMTSSDDIEEVNATDLEIGVDLFTIDEGRSQFDRYSDVRWSVAPVDVQVRNMDGETSIHKARIGLARRTSENLDGVSYMKTVVDFVGLSVDRDISNGEIAEIREITLVDAKVDFRFDDSNFGGKLFAKYGVAGKVETIDNGTYDSILNEGVVADEGTLTGNNDVDSSYSFGAELNYHLGNVVLAAGYDKRNAKMGRLNYTYTGLQELCDEGRDCDENPEYLYQELVTSEESRKVDYSKSRMYVNATSPLYRGASGHAKFKVESGRETISINGADSEQNYLRISIGGRF